jgi:hypothetical protein
MSLPGSLIFPIAALSGCTLGVIVFCALRSFVRERRALHVLYSITAAVATTLWVGVVLVSVVGGAGSQGPVQYTIQDPEGLEVFRARGSVTGVGFLSVPASLVPIGALFRRQTPGERMTGLAMVLLLWLGIPVVCYPPFMPTV